MLLRGCVTWMANRHAVWGGLGGVSWCLTMRFRLPSAVPGQGKDSKWAKERSGGSPIDCTAQSMLPCLLLSAPSLPLPPTVRCGGHPGGQSGIHERRAGHARPRRRRGPVQALLLQPPHGAAGGGRAAGMRVGQGLEQEVVFRHSSSLHKQYLRYTPPTESKIHLPPPFPSMPR